MPTLATPPSATPRSRRITTGPRPSGGVGGTRQGVKCLHAHYAWHLAGGDDPVGRWIDDHLDEVRQPTRPMTRLIGRAAHRGRR